MPPFHRPPSSFPVRALSLSVLAGAILAACGGGGGGGGGGSSEGTSSSAVTSVGAGFPLGVSTHAPLALSGGTLAYASGSDTVSAVAEGRQSLTGSLVSAAGLFDAAYLSHAACYGPTVTYTHHDDSGTSGTLAAQDVTMWADDDTQAPGSPACSVSELNTQLGPITLQTQQGLLLTAAMRRTAATSGSGNLPDPGTTLDLTNQMASQWSTLLSGVTVQSATIAAQSDASQYTYRLVLRRGSGASAESLEIALLHTPNDTSEHFAGVLQMTHSHLTASTYYGCGDALDSITGLRKVAHVSSLGYNRYDNALSLRLRSAQFCGGPGVGSSSYFADVATETESGEMDPAVALDASGLRNATRGWKRELVRYSADLNLSTWASDQVHTWQATPQDGHSRVFLVHDNDSHLAQVFHGFGDDLRTSDGVLTGMYCNWAGPGASHTTITPAFQYQSLSLTGGSWSRQSSALHYAPTNSCAASASMNFDANGDGTLAGGEGANTVNGLGMLTGGRTDVQSEAVDRGYWAPILF